jgi:lipooligosaccharide transport system ATP-binding protein
VLEHVGREVLELKLGEGCEADALLASLDGRLDGHELTEDVLMLYADDAEEVLRVLDHERFPTDSALVRHATLEDVFLRLTGRSLDE